MRCPTATAAKCTATTGRRGRWYGGLIRNHQRFDTFKTRLRMHSNARPYVAEIERVWQFLNLSVPSRSQKQRARWIHIHKKHVSRHTQVHGRACLDCSLAVRRGKRCHPLACREPWPPLNEGLSMACCPSPESRTPSASTEHSQQKHHSVLQLQMSPKRLKEPPVVGPRNLLLAL